MNEAATEIPTATAIASVTLTQPELSNGKSGFSAVIDIVGSDWQEQIKLKPYRAKDSVYKALRSIKANAAGHLSKVVVRNEKASYVLKAGNGAPVIDHDLTDASRVPAMLNALSNLEVEKC